MQKEDENEDDYDEREEDRLELKVSNEQVK